MPWFGKKKSQPETSPGGSVIHRYDSATWSGTRVGVADAPTAKFAEARNEVYERFFGKVRHVFDEETPLIPHIEVKAYSRRGAGGDSICTLVTSGMSDLEMKVDVAAPRRAELIFYCVEPLQEYVDTMRWLAHFPHDQKTWIGPAHTIPNGNPPLPLWGSSVLDTILLLPTIVARDATLPRELVLGGEPVQFLWVVPVTTPECELKLARGVGAILYSSEIVIRMRLTRTGPATHSHLAGHARAHNFRRSAWRPVGSGARRRRGLREADSPDR